MNSYSDSRGSSLIELLVALSINSLIVILVLLGLKTHISVSKKLKNSFSSHGSLYSTYKNAIDSKASYHFFQHFSFNHPKVKGNWPKGDTLTIIYLLPELQLRVIGKTNTQNSLILCSDIPSGKNARDYKNFLVFTVDGYFGVRGELKKSSNPLCNQSSYSGTFFYQDSLVLSKNTNLLTCEEQQLSECLSRALMIVPIKENYSLVLDNSSTLRRISHHNTENQPLFDRVKKLTISEHQLADAAVFLFFETEIASGKSNFSISWQNALEKKYLDFIY